MSTLPGNPAVVASGADSLIASAQYILSAINDLQNLVINSRSKALTKTRKQVKNAETAVEKAHTRYRGTGLALREYQVILADAHRSADAASQRLQRVTADQYTCQRREKALYVAYTNARNTQVPDQNVQHIWNQYQDARYRRRRADDAVTQADNEITQARKRVDDAAQTAIRKIDSAISGSNDGWLDRIKKAIEDIGKALLAIGKWVAEKLTSIIERIVSAVVKVFKILALVVVALVVAVVLAVAIAAVVLLLTYIVVKIVILVKLSLAYAGLALRVLVKAGKIVYRLVKAASTAQRIAAEAKNNRFIEHQKRHGSGVEVVKSFRQNKNDKPGMLRRQGPYGEVRNMADLAAAVYGRNNPLEHKKLVPPGYKLASAENLAELGLEPSQFGGDGTFGAALYVGEGGQYVLVYEGTNPSDLHDLATDVRGGLGGLTDQDKKAVNLAVQVKAALQAKGVTSDNFLICGHSLGGRHAQLASIATATYAYTFNTAGASEIAIDYAKAAATQSGLPDMGLMADSDRILNVQYTKDVLTDVQDNVGFLAQPIGKTWDITGPAENVNPNNSVHEMLKNHSLDPLKAAIDRHNQNSGSDYYKNAGRVEGERTPAWSN